MFLVKRFRAQEGAGGLLLQQCRRCPPIMVHNAHPSLRMRRTMNNIRRVGEPANTERG